MFGVIGSILFGLFMGTMVQQTNIEKLCKSYKKQPKKVKELCDKQL